ncbi:MFS transporter [Streptomyces sp. NBC_01304]|uniref:MFS transporter n=1 Tax=Streptomyces sp. NBC_01304 TaxID=2903818 RepID=UPI002E140A95|nr:MFS transporter [Streptomyces sp. NBC_01304]
MTTAPTTTTSVDPTVHANRWRILGVLGLSLLMVVMDATILHTAMSKIIEDLGPSSIQQLWIVNAYALVISGLLITMGALGDRTGRKRLFNLGLLVFAAASVLAVLFPTPVMLVVSRALLGVGGAMILPSTLSILRGAFADAKERTTAIVVWGTMAAAGGAIGPVVGGALVQAFGWRSAFLVNVPVALAALVLSLKLLPESSTPSATRLDWPSVAISFLGMAAFVQGIKMIGKEGLFELQSGGLLVLGLVMMAYFVRRQLGLPDPLMDVGLFRIRSFSAALVAYLLVTVVLGALLYLGSQWFQIVRGMSPLSAGLRLMPLGAAMLLMGFVTPKILQRLYARTAVALGLLLLGGSLFVPALPGDELTLVGISFAVAGVGCALVMATAVAVIMSAAPPERAGRAAAIQETALELGNVLGISIIGSVVAALYGSWLQAPAGTPAASLEQARGSIGEGAKAARELPAEVGEPLAQAANSAFTRAFDVSMTVTGGVLVAAAVAVYLLIPRFKASADAAH